MVASTVDGREFGCRRIKRCCLRVGWFGVVGEGQ
jgi:hypothetical protein